MTVHTMAFGNHAALVRRALAVFAVAVLLFAAPLLVHAQGAGSTWLTCRDRSLIDMGICYLNASGYWDKFRCNLGYELDLWGCNADLVDKLTPLL